MKAQQFILLKAGDKVRMINDQTALNNAGIHCSWTGQEVTVASVSQGNGNVVCKGPDGASCYVTANLVQDSALPLTKFNRAAVEEIRKNGGNNAIKAEATIRIHAARGALQEALKEGSWHPQMRVVEEQLRAAKLLHSLLSK